MLKGKSAWTHLVWKLPLIAGFIGTCHSWLQCKFLWARCGPENLHPTHARPVLACLCEEKSSYWCTKTLYGKDILTSLQIGRGCLLRQRNFLSSFYLVLLCFLSTSLPGKSFSSGKCCSDNETLCGTSLPCQKIQFWWLFSGWLAWEGGDSNHLCAC